MSTDETRTVSELLKDQRFGMLTTTDPDGTLISRPMTMQEVEFDGDLWFFAARDSRKIAHLAGSPQVNVAVGSSSSWVSLTGTGVVVTDAAKKRELWNSVVGAWFPDGPDDDGVVLLKVEAESAEYWDSPGGRLATALSFAKAKLTGEPYSAGENETVDL
ncbi:MAG TPA: pyridoxamine 5'-phosphate oxidase family protein [Blastococcus sp.]|jgi:general stress protein 26|nr:pyridoxamine 5'-phosphate oxidase family protein [Blastococcus sp.]